MEKYGFNLILTGHAAATTLLLKNGANSEIQNALGCTPLHVAALNGVSAEIVQDLIQESYLLVLKDNKGEYWYVDSINSRLNNNIILLLQHWRKPGCKHLLNNPIIVKYNVVRNTSIELW